MLKVLCWVPGRRLEAFQHDSLRAGQATNHWQPVVADLDLKKATDAPATYELVPYAWAPLQACIQLAMLAYLCACTHMHALLCTCSTSNAPENVQTSLYIVRALPVLSM